MAMNRLGSGVCILGLSLLSTLGCGDDAKPQAPPAVGGAETTAGGSGASSGQAPSAVTAGGASSGGVSGTAGSGGAAGTGGDNGGAAGIASIGGGGAAGGPAIVDPCQGVTTQGECLSNLEARACVVPTGNGMPMLVTTKCRDFEYCDASGGTARCVLNDSACVPDQAVCADKQKLLTCDKTGAWQSQACAGTCRDSAIGGFCVKDTPTTSFFGTLYYERFAALDNYDDWAKTSTYEPAEGVLVLSGNGTDWLDAAPVDAGGAFTVNVPTNKTGQEKLAFFLEHPDSTGAYTELAVFQPKVGDGNAKTDQQLDGQPWSWTVNLSDLNPGDTIKITEKQGSGAIHTYEDVLQVQRFISEFYAAKPGSLVVWLRMNTSWDCGTCFAPWNTEVAATPFDSQMFISGDAGDRSYWSDAVTVHESGHYTMWSYGTSPNEGGQHCVSQPTSPGQAWSEGWATGFSSIFRKSSVYYDKQQGGMFWFDVAQRKYDQENWQRPNPSRGLLQDIDENEVAAMLWDLSQRPEVGTDYALLGVQRPSVTQSKFKRGYTRHVWDMNNCKRSSYQDTGESAPMFADYLDGLVCAGSPPATIDAVTTPQQAYPYPSDKPLCP